MEDEVMINDEGIPTPIKKHFILRQTLPEPIDRPFQWDGGAKQVFDWRIEPIIGHDWRGSYVRIGSWSANYWFSVSLGKTDKQTLRNAMYHLRGTTIGKQSKFEYVEVES